MADTAPPAGRGGLRIRVETWSPEYGASGGPDVLLPAAVAVDTDVELPLAQWRPLAPQPGVEPADVLEVVDGVRRVEARVWITDDAGTTRMGICASYAAGIVRCDRPAGRSQVVAAEVRRGMFVPGGAPDLVTPAGTFRGIEVAGGELDHLFNELQQQMGALEIELAERMGRDGVPGDGRLLLVDGPLSGRQAVPGAVGYVKSHRMAHLPPEANRVVGQLAPGQRTPLFMTQTGWSRYSWYLRLPCPGDHPWAGVVRCELAPGFAPAEAARVADRVAATLPAFASHEHKDPRAPQNLYPIGGLERELRRRLGDVGWVARGVRVGATS